MMVIRSSLNDLAQVVDICGFQPQLQPGDVFWVSNRVLKRYTLSFQSMPEDNFHAVIVISVGSRWANGRVMTGKPLFAVGLRLAASSKELLSRLEGSFLALYQGEENSLTAMEEPYPLAAILAWTTYSRGMLLNSGELAALVHIPDPDNVPETLAAEPGAPAPSLATRDVLIPLGVNRHQGAESLTGISQEWLTWHVAIFGGTGYGKTNLMKYAFAPVLDQGYGMAILDPKGDLARASWRWCRSTALTTWSGSTPPTGSILRP